MEKEKIELLKSVLNLFNKARFDASGAEMVAMSQIIQKFGKLIMELDNVPKPE